MAKDPAFLFYSSDFFTGTATMSFEDKGRYIHLLCLMHQQGRLKEETIRFLVGSLSDILKSKFKTDENGFMYNERLEFEIRKRNNFTESRRNNGLQGGRPKKEEKPLGKHMDNHMGNHMENVNENAIIDDKDNKKGKAVKKFVAPTCNDVIQYFTDNGYTEAAAIKAWNYYEAGQWKDGKGNQVKNWKQKMQGVWFKPENLDRTKIKDEFSHLQGYNPELHNNPLYRYEIAPTGKAIGYWRK